ncbi:uncharacterized protein LOC18443778 [Amborella trichopoda]|uniref:PH domain-containing protein n=1 Tax=Amborella trichopoda TaxID=13333 RepID=U5CZ93_AMBTC|nr:uncharacterized protein LOC18443778 [Amborella trichopoda]ERN15489.1 hypothetical protein AMTR_s00048p00035310 [Amborella trichopoda]|eukprot:XP_020528936.1 uncharacterized protein LOC18443778 [Amborella trichopoda]
MLKDQVAFLLQKYLGNYVRGLSKEDLKISVWMGDVELTNMQLKPEALNALKLPVKVKAGFLGSVKIKVPWSRLGQEPVLVYLDRIFLIVEPATQVEGRTEDAVQDVKKNRVRELELKLLEAMQPQKTEVNTSWLGSLINTIIGNLKLSITNIHIRYEDLESNPGHPFAAGATLAKLSAVTVDDSGKETFVTGGALDHIQKSVELDRLAVYLDCDIHPWKVDKPWENLLPNDWSEIFECASSPSTNVLAKGHSYILQPVSGNAKYTKLRLDESRSLDQPLQRATVKLDDVTLCLSKDEYRDILKLAENFATFNQRLTYSHYRPNVGVRSNPRLWWKYAYKVISDQIKKASGRLYWEQVLKYARLRKRYISLYASLLKSDLNRLIVENNKDIDELDRELDIDVILEWRMLAHKFVEQSMESGADLKKQQTKKSWWSLGWSGQSNLDSTEPRSFTEDDWEQINKIIGYKEGMGSQLLPAQDKRALQTLLEIRMEKNASKLLTEDLHFLADLSCEGLDCSVKLFSEAKIVDVKLGSYRLSSPNGLLAESATADDSLVGVFTYMPFDAQVDWSLVGKASPCYMTYLKDSVDQIVSFFGSSNAISQTIAVETAAAVQMTIDGVKRSAQQQMSRALKDRARFLLDLDIAAPKITIPTNFCPDNIRETKLLLDLGSFTLRTQDDGVQEAGSLEEHLYLQFKLGLRDISAFLVDGDFNWRESPSDWKQNRYLPVLDKCGIMLKLQQIRSENPLYPSTRVAVRLPSLGFHLSPARYHRLIQVVKIFQTDRATEDLDSLRPWNQADFEGWLSLLAWKGVGNREAVWQRRYVCLVGPFLYVLASPSSKSYKQCVSLRGKQLYNVPAESVGNHEHVLAICDAGQSNLKVVELANALVMRFDSDESKKTWQNRLQGAIYRTSIPSVASISEISSSTEDTHTANFDVNKLVKNEKIFITGILDELWIRFSSSYQGKYSFKKMLLAKESRLLEFRATGGQVELSIREHEMFVGVRLKALEVEDLYGLKDGSPPRFLAKSFIESNVNASTNSSLSADAGNAGRTGIYDQNENDGDDKFFEASENLVESSETNTEYLSAQRSFPDDIFLKEPPSFNRITGLLPDAGLQNQSESLESSGNIDSFVKAQIAIYDPDSPLYINVDKQVTVTLATLTFFCYRPTILGILDFVNCINMEEKVSDSSNKHVDFSTSMEHDSSGMDLAENIESTYQRSDSIVKGLLGRGKSRVIFSLILSLARARILLKNENGTRLATLSQNNLHTDIKVFPSSFSIKAALGNLKISDDSLSSSHPYFWVCDMRNPGGTSFVELEFNSFSEDDDDYKGYDYSLFGQLSEVRVIYLNRFIEEVLSYFLGLVPRNKQNVVKLKDQVTNSEQWFTTSEIEGSPALKLDLSLRKPIILMPKRTDSLDCLELDVEHITVRNTFQWLCGDKNEMSAVHMEEIKLQIKDINLAVGSGSSSGENIIQEIRGFSIVIRRSLRDLLHRIPGTEVYIKMEELKAALSCREYQIITECSVSNISEEPHLPPPLDHGPEDSIEVEEEHVVTRASGSGSSELPDRGAWITMNVSVSICLVELCLHSGSSRDSPLATVQVSDAWLLYRSCSSGDNVLMATLKGFSVLDDREGTEPEFRLAVGKPKSSDYIPIDNKESLQMVESGIEISNSRYSMEPVVTMLILDVKFGPSSTIVSLCVQRPLLLVALDFLLATVEFFVPSIRDILSNEENDSALDIVGAIILDQPVYYQSSEEISLSPRRPLIVDDERFDHFIYDGKGGCINLQDRQGVNLARPSKEAIVYVGNGKSLQFKNVHIKNGEFLDSCIYLGANSSYSALEEDHVFLGKGNVRLPQDGLEEMTGCIPSSPSVVTSSSITEFIVELQAIGPELTFYNSSKDVGESVLLPNKLLHAELDANCRLMLKGDTIDVNANALGFTIESNGVRILEPFDASISFSRVSGKMNIHLVVSDIFMNFSFSILQLFMGIQEDIMAFLRMTSRKATVICTQFDRIGTIQSDKRNQTYAFWRPRAPPGFAVLGDCLTPLDKPPSKGVLAVNTSFARVKRPISFELIWSSPASDEVSNSQILEPAKAHEKEFGCSVWFPVAPAGYVALGCVVSSGRTQPPLSSALCILQCLVSPGSLKDCVVFSFLEQYFANLAFWRVDNSIGSFLPADPLNLRAKGKPYELRHMIFGHIEESSKPPSSPKVGEIVHKNNESRIQSQGAATVSPGSLFETVARFTFIWWNRGSGSRKKISIWRPIVSDGLVYFGDIAMKGYEPPNSTVVLRDTADEGVLKAPLDFQQVGHVKKQRGVDTITFWLPQAPPGFVSLGCIACKGAPKNDDFGSLRCIRSDLVTAGDQFPEENMWDTSELRHAPEQFSLWTLDNKLGTFLVRNGLKKPPKRFALKLADPYSSSQSDDTMIDAEIKRIAASLFDDFGGLMVPLFNISFSGITFGLHGRSDNLNSTFNFSLLSRSYNDRYDSWEPLVEPTDGFVRYQYDQRTPGAPSQLSLTSTRDLNLNLSVSNMNMLLQAYASWNNLSQFHESYKKKRSISAVIDGRSVIDIHQKKNYYIVPQNKLGQDIFLRINEKGRSYIIRLLSGGTVTVKVPAAKDILDSTLRDNINGRARKMVTVVIADGELPSFDGIASHQYMVAVRIFPKEYISNESMNRQCARTCCVNSEHILPSGNAIVSWGEVFFFKVESLDSFMIEFMVTDLGKGEPVGIYSSSLREMVSMFHMKSNSFESKSKFAWIDLAPVLQGERNKKSNGRLRCSLISPRFEDGNEKEVLSTDTKHQSFQIAPTKDGPWTTLRLNYAAPAACWRLGDDLVASEVSVKDGDRYVTIRSLVSIVNNTDYAIDLCLHSRDSNRNSKLVDDDNQDQEKETINNSFMVDENFEIEKYDPSAGWVRICRQVPSPHGSIEQKGKESCSDSVLFNMDLPTGWEWLDDWHVDKTSVDDADGWVYVVDLDQLKCSLSFNSENSSNSVRQRRWIRNRKRISRDMTQPIAVGLIKPGQTIPLPLSGLTHPGSTYALQCKPENDPSEYSWSCVVGGNSKDSGQQEEVSQVCVSTLCESEVLLFCPALSEGSSKDPRGLWFCLSIHSSEIGKDINSDPIKDWNLVIKSPFSMSNFLPLSAEFSVMEKQPTGEFVACSRGIFLPGETIKVYNADLRNPLYFSLLPQGGWLPVHEAILISHPSKKPSQTLTLRNSFSGRIVRVVVEQIQDGKQPVERVFRVYAPYWIDFARSPPLNYRIFDISGRSKARRRGISNPFSSNKYVEKVVEYISSEEIFEGYTIDSTFNFGFMGLAVAISCPSEECFGPISDLSPLAGSDGFVDLWARDNDGNNIRLFASTKPCPYQSVPTKVLCIRPYMTFTNRIGQDMYIKLGTMDFPKVLRASDLRVSFMTRAMEESEKLQIRLEDTEWSFPLVILKEDTATVVLRKHNGNRIFLRTVIRGYEEGSRFVIVFRLGLSIGPIRIENRMSKAINIRQCGLGDNAWIPLKPFSTTNFTWEDPCGQRLLDVTVQNESSVSRHQFSLDKTGDYLSTDGSFQSIQLHVVEMGDMKIALFMDNPRALELGSQEKKELLESVGLWGSPMLNKKQADAAPIELMIELGILGVSIIDAKPRENLYLYLERVFVSYSTGYDGGMTSRLKLILGYLQIDNQLPLALMPVLLAPENTVDAHHPVFKMTITMSNDNVDGTLVYPYVCFRVTDKYWSINIHEPIIWELMDFYKNLRTDRIPANTSITEVDPEIRVDLIDVSEIRLKLSLETAPSQRPHGVLGVWSPILSAVGNAFKLQVHLRKVVHKNRFMRKSSVLPAIVNRIWRDLIHNPFHLIFSVDVLGMTSSTLATLSKGFAELSTDGQFLQLRLKQGRSRRITGVSDGIIQGAEALAQGVAFGVSGVVTKPVESVRQHGVLGLVQGFGRAFLGFIAQPVSGALDFFSLTVDGIGASCTRCLEAFNNRVTPQRIRNPRAIRARGVLEEYCERAAVGQMVLHLAEASHRFGCTEIFKEPSKYAWSDFYEDHFVVPQQRILLVTNKRIMLLQCSEMEKMDKKPSKILWDVPWEELLALELAKGGYRKPSHLILHLKNFKRSEPFARVVKCNVEGDEEEGDSQAMKICARVGEIWKAYQADLKSISLKVILNQGQVSVARSEAYRDVSSYQTQALVKPREFHSVASGSDATRFRVHTVNFQKVWSSEREMKGQFTLCPQQAKHDDEICSIWNPMCPDGYVSVGDIARIGCHLPNVAAVFQNVDGRFALPIGYDLVWRNCIDDYVSPVSIWLPRAPDGYVSIGCVAIAGYFEPPQEAVYCVHAEIVEETVFEEIRIWSAPGSYPWACYLYQVQSEALQFIALRQPKEHSEWKPMRISKRYTEDLTEV